MWWYILCQSSNDRFYGNETSDKIVVTTRVNLLVPDINVLLVYGVGHLWNMSDWPDPSTVFLNLFISCCPVHLVAANLANLIGWKFPDSPRRRSVTMWQSHPLLPKNPHRECCQGRLHKPSDKPPALVQLDLLRCLAPARLRCVFKHLWFLVKLIVTVLQVRFAATKASSAFEVRMF